MKVYLVVWASQMDYEIGGVFSDHERAYEVAAELEKDNGYGYSNIEEYEV